MSTIAAARTLIAEAKLPAVAAFGADAPAAGMGMPDFDPDKAQAVVVGSDVVSFSTGVDADFRQAIADSALFAQLVALNKTKGADDTMAFFDAYFSTLMGLGWMVQKLDKAEFTYKGDGFDVHEAVTGVITAFLSPISGAAAAVLLVLNNLQKMSQSTPFITLFDRQSRTGKIAKFQFTYVHSDPDHGLAAEIAAFTLDATEDVTQVLFFRLRKKRDHLRRAIATLSIDTEGLKKIKPNLAAKVAAYRNALVAEANLGPVPGTA